MDIVVLVVLFMNVAAILGLIHLLYLAIREVKCPEYSKWVYALAALGQLLALLHIFYAWLDS